jgi:tetratricopeptide (TPR) repeat protein
METVSLPQMLEKAKTAYETEDFEEAARWYEQAAKEYTAQGDAINAAEMNNNRSVCLLRADNPNAAYQAALGTEQIFAQTGDVRRQAMALGNQAAALDSMKKYEEAIQLYRQSNELLKQINAPDLRIYVLQSLSGLHLRRRHYLEALAAMQAALDLKSNLSLRERILKKLLQIVFGMLGH